jgi:hypothetical protein
MNDFFHSRLFLGLIVGLGTAAILLIVFGAGMQAGFRKADFSYRFGDNYERNFGGPRMMLRMPMFGDGFIGGHGTFGRIIKINLPDLVVSGNDDVERIVAVSSSTQIRKFRTSIAPRDLKTGDNVIVIGQPDSKGIIGAELIRVFSAR